MIASVPLAVGRDSLFGRSTFRHSRLLAKAPWRIHEIRNHATLEKILAHASTSSERRLCVAAAAPSGHIWELREERGLSFVTGEAFYRAESCPGRDLAVLAAALHRERTGCLRVLDVMAGSGMRGARYFSQADADEVWINDGSTDLHDAMVYNMCTAAELPAHADAQTVSGAVVDAMAAFQARDEAPTGPSPAAEANDETAASPGTSNQCVVLEQTLRDLVTRWEGQAQRLRLGGLARDVWQWDVPRLASGSGPDEASKATPLQGAAADAIKALVAEATTADPGVGHCDDSTARGSSSSGTDSLAGAGSSSSSCDGDSETGSGRGAQGGVQGAERDRPPGSSARRIRISHADANRLLTSCYMRESYYDVVDVDSFGSETMHFPAAIDAVRYGGLLYLTSTDGFTSSGKRPARGLAAYGTYARATPWANEQGLRMIIGAAVREAAARGVTLTPVFSLYSYHGPVFRVMLRATRSAEWHVRHYGFMGHCFVHGDNYTVSWPDLGTATCRCETRGRRPAPGSPIQSSPPVAHASSLDNPPRPSSSTTDDTGSTSGLSGEGIRPKNAGRRRNGAAEGPVKGGRQGEGHRAPQPEEADGDEGGQRAGEGFGAVGDGPVASTGTPLVLAGPLWTGPLHDKAELRAMAKEAARRGWAGFGLDETAAPHLQNRVKSSRNVRPLEDLLEVLIEEADPRLPPGFFSIDASVARRLARPPPRDALITVLRQEGFAAARCHLEARAFRTNACMADILRVAEKRLGIPQRRQQR